MVFVYIRIECIICASAIYNLQDCAVQCCLRMAPCPGVLCCKLERLKLQFVFVSYNGKRCSRSPSIYKCICIFMKGSLNYSCSCLCIGCKVCQRAASAPANHSHLIISYKFDFKLDSQTNTLYTFLPSVATTAHLLHMYVCAPDIKFINATNYT